jgi:hypothetical protein
MKESNRVMELRIPYKNWNTKRREYQLARDSSAWFLRLPLAAVDLSSPPTPHEEELELLLRRRIRRSSTCSSVAAACRRTSTWRGHYGEVGGPAESERRFFFGKYSGSCWRRALKWWVPPSSPMRRRASGESKQILLSRMRRNE